MKSLKKVRSLTCKCEFWPWKFMNNCISEILELSTSFILVVSRRSDSCCLWAAFPQVYFTRSCSKDLVSPLGRSAVQYDGPDWRKTSLKTALLSQLARAVFTRRKCLAYKRSPRMSHLHLRSKMTRFSEDDEDKRTMSPRSTHNKEQVALDDEVEPASTWSGPVFLLKSMALLMLHP